MSDAYTDARREPAKPHQCAHNSEQDGTRCRATAMHNQIMCFHHRVDDIPTVIENDPFLLEDLDTREAIQRALGQVAARLACNHMDFERAKLLLKTINFAMRNLPPHPRPTRTAPPPAQSATAKDQQPSAGDDDAPPPPEREYTPQEQEYFNNTVSVLGFTPITQPRPASITDQDIIDRTNHYRRHIYCSPLVPRFDASGALIAMHCQPDCLDAQITPPATLPTLNAAASGLPLRKLKTNARGRLIRNPRLHRAAYR